MTNEFPPAFARQYDNHLKHLKLKGFQPKAIDAYALLPSPAGFLTHRTGQERLRSTRKNSEFCHSRFAALWSGWYRPV